MNTNITAIGLKAGIFPLLLAALLILPVQEAEAQSPLQKPNDKVTISVKGGGVFPTASLGGGEFNDTGAIGGTVGLWLSGFVDSPGFSVADIVGVRGNFLFGRTRAQGPVPPEFVGANPDVYQISGDLLLRLPIAVGQSLFQPYVLGGLGTKVYDFANDSHAEFAGNFGGGLELRFGPRRTIGITTELQTFVSEFDQLGTNNTQYDLAWTGGLTVNF